MSLADQSIHAWIEENGIRNEKGDPIDFASHPYLFHIYADDAQNLCVMKGAQTGLSTCEILKNHYDAKKDKMDIIYTLPTDADVQVFVGGKVNRIIAANPCMLEDVDDKDSIEQKQIGKNSMIYFRGTWSKKAAIMVTADRVVHDEKDSSKQDVVRDYQARLQHSKFKQTHVFSHPSTSGFGVHEEWEQSDQKKWFIKCPACNKHQTLSWNMEDPSKMSIDIKERVYICKKCKKTLTDDDRRRGQWVARVENAKFSGYHVPLLIAPYVSAGEIIDKFNDKKQTKDFFYNKVLGLPYAGSGNTVTQDTILGNLSEAQIAPQGRLVCGVDTGIALRYVVGSRAGIHSYGEVKDYMPDEVNKLKLEDTLEYWLKKFPDLVMVIDQGGDIIGSRKLRAKYPGRVFLCMYRRDRKTMSLIQWGKDKESGSVLVDRNRLMQMVIGEFKDRKIPLYGTFGDYHDYWLHWSHIYRVVEEDELGMPTFVWKRNDRDDWVHATIYWRVGMDRFGSEGMVIQGQTGAQAPKSYMIQPGHKVAFNPEEFFDEYEQDDWRSR